jgi:hypothetical protein
MDGVLIMGDRKPIGVAYRDQDIDGGEIGRNDPQLVRGSRLYATEELGYCSCAFSEVAQLTNKTTAVVINTPTGRITMDDAPLNNNSVAKFRMNNSTINSNDVVIINIKLNGSTPDAYIAFVSDIGKGFADIALWNRSGGQLSEAVELNFATIRNFVE